MSRGMADIIAGHDLLEGREAGQPWMRNKELAWCSCGHDHGSWIDTGTNDHPNWDALHAAHVAEVLTQAGYGLLVDHYAADPHGRALVQKIHDRKAGK